MPAGRVGVSFAILNDTIFAIGGNPIYISSTSANEQYFPLVYGTPDPIPTVAPLITLSVRVSNIDTSAFAYCNYKRQSSLL